MSDMEITITIKIGEKSVELTMAEAIELHAALAGMFTKNAPSPVYAPYQPSPPLFGPIKRDAPWEIKCTDRTAVDPNMHLHGMITSKASNGDV